ncbi:MAG: hypothetical protein AAGA48_32525 [Myxococcota bacterium]
MLMMIGLSGLFTGCTAAVPEEAAATREVPAAEEVDHVVVLLGMAESEDGLAYDTVDHELWEASFGNATITTLQAPAATLVEETADRLAGLVQGAAFPLIVLDPCARTRQLQFQLDPSRFLGCIGAGIGAVPGAQDIGCSELETYSPPPCPIGQRFRPDGEVDETTWGITNGHGVLVDASGEGSPPGTAGREGQGFGAYELNRSDGETSRLIGQLWYRSATHEVRTGSAGPTPPSRKNADNWRFETPAAAWPPRFKMVARWGEGFRRTTWTTGWTALEHARFQPQSPGDADVSSFEHVYELRRSGTTIGAVAVDLVAGDIARPSRVWWYADTAHLTKGLLRPTLDPATKEPIAWEWIRKDGAARDAFPIRAAWHIAKTPPSP